MIITLQTIEHIVKQIGSDFDIEFKVEVYKDDKGNANKILHKSAYIREA